MKYFTLIIIAILFTSCKNAVTQLTAKVVDADSMAINYFKGDGSMDTVVAVKIIRNKEQVNQLAKMAGGTITDNFKCGYDGSLHFFKMSKVIQDIDFRMNDVQCMHFSFMLEGKLYATALSPEAKQLLESLRK
jgi:hypothetical protein